MFFRQISDFEENYKFLDRLNSIVFNVWKDDNAESFKTQSMEQLEMFYRNYINEMRQKSNELRALEQEINELLEDLRQISQDMTHMTVYPEIDGCLLCSAQGIISDNESGEETFIIKSNEPRDRLEEIAYSRCNRVYDIENVSIETPL